MSEFSAFLAGLILGDTSTPSKPQPKKNPIKKNVALQDVAFCQALRNTIDRLDDFVREKHPSPQDFITYLLPQYDFEEPYTTKEQKLIEEREQTIQKYVAWIEERISRGELTGESSWENLAVIKMIWQDETHTPDPDNLDLLFGTYGITKPIKKNGRVYEYDTYFEPFDGIAKGFFTTVAARVIESLCIEVTRSILAQEGFELDYHRFEYNAAADKGNYMETWRLEERRKAYITLLATHSKFCKSPWSEWSQEIYKTRRRADDELPYNEMTRRARERRRICRKMTREERKEFDGVDEETMHRFIWLFIILMALLTIVPFMICGFETNNEEAKDIAVYILWGMIIIDCCLFLVVKFSPGVLLVILYPAVVICKRIHFRKEIENLQTAYYENPDSPDGRQYAEFLSRIKR